MHLDSNFVSNIKDIFGQTGSLWLKELPSILKRLGEKHGFRFMKPMPKLSYNFVGLVEIIATSEFAVLKMAPSNENIAKEYSWLQCFDDGVAKTSWFDEESHAFLMENISPGNALKSMVSIDDDEATRVICRTIKTLHSHQKILHQFKHLTELASSLPILKGLIDGKLLSKAQSLFRDLTSDRAQDVLLHGDLHHDNIISSGTSWKAIDPHGYVGDPVFEVGPMIYNPGDCFPKERAIHKTIERRLAILQEELNFDLKRIKGWTFCMTILSIAWTVEDHGYVPDFELSIANIIDAL